MKSPPDRRQLVRVVAVLVLAAATVAVVGPTLGQALGYDESYNLQIVGNLLHGHGYATDGLLAAPGESPQFDSRISTGPSLMLPVAGVVALLGEHVWVYRLVPCLYFLVLLVLWFWLGRRYAGFWPGAVAVASLLAVNTVTATYGASPVLGPGDVLGEVAATTLLLAACASVRRPAWSGLLLGLAVMAKTIALLGLPVIGVVILVVARRRGESALSAGLKMVGAGLVPVLAWQVARFVVLGADEAQRTNSRFVSFLRQGGSGLSGESVGGPLSRLSGQVQLVTVPGAVVVLLLVVVLVARWTVVRSLAEENPDKAAALVAIVAAALVGTTIEAWWLFYSGLDYVRHSLIGVYLLLPALAVLATAVLARVPRPAWRVVLGLGLAASFGFAAVVHLHDYAELSGPSLADQRTLADQLAAADGDYMFSGRSQLADLTLLGAPRPRPLDEDGGLAIFRVPGATPNLRFPDERALCVTVVFEAAGYVGCEIAPGSVPEVFLDATGLPDGQAAARGSSR